MVGEITGTQTVSYLRGLNLIHDGSSYYLFNAHADVVNLTNSSGSVTKTYSYDAFGVEKNPSETDTNHFRYCGEYWDAETETYYLRARYYDPALGRFTQQDTHWNTANMIYGDNPQKINEREDRLGLKSYSFAPQITSIVQSGNLYVYCVNNPVYLVDLNGNFVITTTALIIGAGALIGGISGGIVGNKVANDTGATGWKKVGYIAGLTTVGAIGGGILGGLAAPAVVSATGAAGVSISTAGITTIATVGTSFGKMGVLIANNPNISVDWSLYGQHAYQRMTERGITQQMINTWVKTGKVLQQGTEKFVFVTKQGIAVVTKAGKLITAYTCDQFDDVAKNIVEKLYGK